MEKLAPDRRGLGSGSDRFGMECPMCSASSCGRSCTDGVYECAPDTRRCPRNCRATASVSSVLGSSSADRDDGCGARQLAEPNDLSICMKVSRTQVACATQAAPAAALGYEIAGLTFILQWQSRLKEE